MDSPNGESKIEPLLCMWIVDENGCMKKEKEVTFCPRGKLTT